MAATVWSRPSRRSAKEAARETARGMLNALRTTARKVHRDTEDASGEILLTSSGPNGGANGGNGRCSLREPPRCATGCWSS
jgi:hypothetical protein